MKVFVRDGCFQFYTKAGDKSKSILESMGFVFHNRILQRHSNYYYVHTLFGNCFSHSSFPKNSPHWDTWEIVPTRELEQTLISLLL